MLSIAVQISVDIWDLHDKVLLDDPNESSAVYLLTSDNKHAVCGTDFSPHQLLCWRYQLCFYFVEETFDHVPGNKIDQVSPVFISEHQCR